MSSIAGNKRQRENDELDLIQANGMKKVKLWLDTLYENEQQYCKSLQPNSSVGEARLPSSVVDLQSRSCFKSRTSFTMFPFPTSSCNDSKELGPRNNTSVNYRLANKADDTCSLFQGNLPTNLTMIPLPDVIRNSDSCYNKTIGIPMPDIITCKCNNCATCRSTTTRNTVTPQPKVKATNFCDCDACKCSNVKIPSQCSTCGHDRPYIQGEFVLEYRGFTLVKVKYFVPKNGLESALHCT